MTGESRAPAASSLTGRLLVVVGGAGGIGSAITRGLLARDARVVVLDVSEDSLERLGATLPGHAAARLVAGDVTDAAAVTSLLDEARDGRPVDGLVNVVGLFEPGSFAESQPESWERALRVNLLGVMAPAWAVSRLMIPEGRGSIVHFASTAGEYGSIRPAAAYAAAKGGVIAFTKSLARELGPEGIRVNCVSPGPVDTRMFGAGHSPDLAEAAARTLIGRIGRPEELEPAVAYLLSDDSSYVTGEVLRVNGGSLI